MSQENVEIVRQVYEAAASRNSAAVFALYDSEVELDCSRLGLGVKRGHEGLQSLFGDWHEAWGSVEYSYEELIDAGERVIAVVTRQARGRASGVETKQPFTLVWTIRDGKVVRVAWFLIRADALEDAGLSE